MDKPRYGWESAAALESKGRGGEGCPGVVIPDENKTHLKIMQHCRQMGMTMPKFGIKTTSQEKGMCGKWSQFFFIFNEHFEFITKCLITSPLLFERANQDVP